MRLLPQNAPIVASSLPSLDDRNLFILIPSYEKQLWVVVQLLWLQVYVLLPHLIDIIEP